MLDHRLAGSFRDATAQGQLPFPVIGVPHSPLVVAIVHDHLAKHLIPFQEVAVVQLCSANLEFLEETAGGALLVFEPMAPLVDPRVSTLVIPTEDRGGGFADVLAGMIEIHDATVGVGLQEHPVVPGPVGHPHVQRRRKSFLDPLTSQANLAWKRSLPYSGVAVQ